MWDLAAAATPTRVAGACANVATALKARIQTNIADDVEGHEALKIDHLDKYRAHGCLESADSVADFRASLSLAFGPLPGDPPMVLRRTGQIVPTIGSVAILAQDLAGLTTRRTD